MKSPNSTVENPILFFQYLLIYEGYNQLVKDFLEGLEESQLHSANFEELSFVDYSPDEFYNYDFRETKFRTSLLRILNAEKIKSVKLIDQKLSSYIGEERRNEVTEILNSLYSMYRNATGISNPGPKEEVQKSLLFIIKHIQNVYFFLDLKHRAFRLVDSLKNKKVEDSFFGCDDYKSKFFAELHDLFYRKSIIKSLDDREDSRAQFVEVMASTNPQETGSEIVFSIDNMEVAYLISQLKPYFKNFRNTTISRSQCFKNKGNKILESNDLDNALSRFINKNNSRVRPEIQSVIDGINDLITKFTK